ncbi:MAG: DsrE family protein [Opitutae bacterium]|nr:DsrE family protein [Opitutae bacterium]
MKKLNTYLLLAALGALPLATVAAEPANPPAKTAYRAVFDVTMDGIEKWDGVLQVIENVQRALGAENVTIEVVAHGRAIGLVVAKTSAEHPALQARIAKLHAQGIIFGACQNTMRHLKLEKKDLVEEAVPVDAAVAELIRKQAEGWAYIKL